MSKKYYNTNEILMSKFGVEDNFSRKDVRKKIIKLLKQNIMYTMPVR